MRARISEQVQKKRETKSQKTSAKSLRYKIKNTEYKHKKITINNIYYYTHTQIGNKINSFASAVSPQNSTTNKPVQLMQKFHKTYDKYNY